MLLRAGGGGRNFPKHFFARNSGVSIAVASGAFIPIPLDTIIDDTSNGAVIDPIFTDSIDVPSWAQWVKITGHITYQHQAAVGSVPGEARLHLFRNGNSTAEAHYHNVQFYNAPMAATAPDWQVAPFAVTPWIKVLTPNERWGMRAWQNTGQPATLLLGVESWLNLEFK